MWLVRRHSARASIPLPDAFRSANRQAFKRGMAAAGPALFDEVRPKSLSGIARAIQECRRWPIGFNGTRAVMGEGRVTQH